MAGSDEAVTFEGVPRTALLQDPDAVEQLKGKEFARGIMFVAEIKNTSGDPLDLEKEMAALIDKLQKLMMDKAKLFSDGNLFDDGDKFRFFILKEGTPSYRKMASALDEIQKGKAAAVIQAEEMDNGPVEVQTEKMDKAPVEVQMEKMGKAPVEVDKAEHFSDGDTFDDGDKFRFFILKDGTPSYRKLVSSIDEIQKGKAAAVIQAEKMDKAPVEVQTEKMDKAPVDDEQNPRVETGKEEEEADTRWWDVSVGENGKYRLPDGYVRSLLALPRPTRHDEIACLQTPNLAQLLGVTEESLEKDRELLYGAEAAARSKRIDDSFVLFQGKVREQWERQGYVEVDEEYITNLVKMQEYSNQLAKEQDWTDFPCADRNDPAYASWYEHCSEEDPPGFCLVKYS